MGRIGVTTAWDLGIGDRTAIWFLQEVGREIHCIDYYEASGMDLGHYVRELIKRDYVYGRHILPHDVAARELGTGVSRVEILENLGLRSGHLWCDSHGAAAAHRGRHPGGTRPIAEVLV